MQERKKEMGALFQSFVCNAMTLVRFLHILINFLIEICGFKLILAVTYHARKKQACVNIYSLL